MTIAIDASTPALAVSSVAASTLASTSFTPPANSLVVVGITTAGNTASGNNVASVSDGTNTYTALANAFQAANLTTAISCHYYATSPGAITVTATFVNNPSQGQCMMCIVLTGAAATQTGAVATHGAGAQEAASGATPSVTVNATAAGSLILAQEANFSVGVAPTPSGDQSTTFNGHTAVYNIFGNGYWTQYEPTLTTGPGNVTISDTAPTNLDIAMCGAEILAASSGTPTVTTSDSATTTEFVVIAIIPPITFTLEINVADTAHITDSPLAAFAGTLAIRVADTITTTEHTQVGNPPPNTHPPLGGTWDNNTSGGTVQLPMRGGNVITPGTGGNIE